MDGATPKVGDKVWYNYHQRNNSGKIISKHRFFGFVVSVDRIDEAFTVIWWDNLGNHSANREATMGNGHRQFELIGSNDGE